MQDRYQGEDEDSYARYATGPWEYELCRYGVADSQHPHCELITQDRRRGQPFYTRRLGSRQCRVMILLILIRF